MNRIALNIRSEAAKIIILNIQIKVEIIFRQNIRSETEKYNQNENTDRISE